MKALSKIKFLLTLGFIATLIFTGCKNEPKHDSYTITGKVTGADVQWVKIFKPQYTDRGNSKLNVIDSVQVENGTFKMKGKVEYVDMINISIDDNKYYSMGGFLLENSPITLDIDLSTADKYGQFEPIASGSKMQDEFTAENDKIMAVYNGKKYAPLIAFREEMGKAYESKDETLINKTKEKGVSLNDLMNERQEEYQMAKVNYVIANPSSPVAPYILSFQFSEGRMSNDRMKEVYPVFEGDSKKTAMFKYFEKTYNDIFKNLGVGSIAPDFNLNDLNGKEVTLSNVNANYKLVDFWASWCVPCRASFPHLKELYKKYHKNGFEVLGVGTADIGSKWKNAIKEDQTPWIHVFDGEVNKEGNGKSGPYGEVAVKYGIPFLPSTFLMDENQKIILRNPSKEELDAKLKELYKY